MSSTWARADELGSLAAAAIHAPANPPARPVYLGVPTDLLSAEAGSASSLAGTWSRYVSGDRTAEAAALAASSRSAADLGGHRRASARPRRWRRWPSGSPPR